MDCSLDESISKVWSWEPRDDPSAPSFLLTKSGVPIDFFVYDDIISKHRLEKIINRYGGSVCRDVVETYTIILVNEEFKPPEVWGPCYARSFIRDCIESLQLLELSDYLIEGSDFTRCKGKISSYLFNEIFKFRKDPLPTLFYSRDSKMSAEEVANFYNKSQDLKGKNLICQKSLSFEVENFTLITKDNSQWKLKGYFCECRKEFKVLEGFEDKYRKTYNNICSTDGKDKQQVSPSEVMILPNANETENCQESNKSTTERNTENDNCSPVEEDELSLLAPFHGIKPKKKGILNTGTRAKRKASPTQPTISSKNSVTDIVEQAAFPPQPGTSSKDLEIRVERQVSSLEPGEDKDTRLAMTNCSTSLPSSSNKDPIDRYLLIKPSAAQAIQDSDEDFRFGKSCHKHHKFIVPDKHSKTKFSFKEKSDILKFIVARQAFGRLKSNTLYKEMEQKNICPKRTYQSMKNHFIKVLLYELDNYDFLDEVTKRKLQGEW